MNIDEVAYQEASRSVSQQQQVLDTIRTRAGLLLSAASVATAFFADAALVPEKAWSLPAKLALFGYVLVGVVTLVVLLPVYTFHFTFRADVLRLDAWKRLGEDEMYRHLAKEKDGQYERNQTTIDRLHWGLVAICGLLGGEIVCWLYAL